MDDANVRLHLADAVDGAHDKLVEVPVLHEGCVVHDAVLQTSPDLATQLPVTDL